MTANNLLSIPHPNFPLPPTTKHETAFVVCETQGRIGRIIKLDQDVQSVTKEATALIGKAMVSKQTKRLHHTPDLEKYIGFRTTGVNNMKGTPQFFWFYTSCLGPFFHGLETRMTVFRAQLLVRFGSGCFRLSVTSRASPPPDVPQIVFHVFLFHFLRRNFSLR